MSRFRRPLAFRLWLGVNLAAKLAAIPFFINGHVLLGCLIAITEAPWLVWQLFAPRARGLGPSLQHFQTLENTLWLTIDDGPDPATTPHILALLAHHNARATFFLIGEKAARHPELVAAIRSAGHTIGNHTTSHPIFTFWCLFPRRLTREIDSAQLALADASSGNAPTLFRSPAGHKNIFLHPLLHVRQLALVHWSARAYDTRCRDAATALRRLIPHLRPGAIVLLHESGPAPAIRIQTLSALLDYLRSKNLRCVIPSAESLTLTASPAPRLPS